MLERDIDSQLQVIMRGAVEIISEEELRRKLVESIRDKRPLSIKAGFDPTAPDIHLGHTVLLRKLRQFQDLGHQVYFLIGDFTARVGDPTGRSQLRKQLTKEEVIANAATYKQQVSKILDLETLHIIFNSEWFEAMTVLDMLKLTSHATVAQMLARADFKQRLSQQHDISLLEFMYPLLQGYDSVKLESDIELGGTDQIFNLLIGRDIQKDFAQPPQVVITMPLLEGTDGIQKMSKSYANYIGINESAQEIFGKVMSISDEMMLKYYTLLTDENIDAVKKMHPKEAKLNLSESIVRQYHGNEAALNARDEFQRVFSQKEIPDDTGSFKVDLKKNNIVEIMVQSKLVPSRNEARRILVQGGVSFNGEKIEKEDACLGTCGILKIGKRRFLKIESL